MLKHQFVTVRRAGLSLLAAALLAGGAACAQPGPAPVAVSGPGCVMDGPPQAGLPVDTLTVQTARGPARFKVQIAADDATREKGLMFVRKMAPDEGMIFDFRVPQATAFWMHNTYIPLDLLFVQADGRILTIARNAPTCNDGAIPSGGAVRTVIELNAGTADRLGIKPGDVVTSEKIYPPR
ncbi:MAG TPA: DUF192 domain-containing protein [Caulobacteraceae bacterium]|nr:DUF192 domain-containing protein [Caulobacteraceae bacterium]